MEPADGVVATEEDDDTVEEEMDKAAAPLSPLGAWTPVSLERQKSVAYTFTTTAPSVVTFRVDEFSSRQFQWSLVGGDSSIGDGVEVAIKQWKDSNAGVALPAGTFTLTLKRRVLRKPTFHFRLDCAGAGCPAVADNSCALAANDDLEQYRDASRWQLGSAATYQVDAYGSLLDGSGARVDRPELQAALAATKAYFGLADHANVRNGVGFQRLTFLPTGTQLIRVDYGYRENEAYQYVKFFVRASDAKVVWADLQGLEEFSPNPWLPEVCVWPL